MCMILITNFLFSIAIPLPQLLVDYSLNLKVNNSITQNIKVHININTDRHKNDHTNTENVLLTTTSVHVPYTVTRLCFH